MDEQIQAIVERALAEDVGSGDVTSQWILPPELGVHGHLLAKAQGVLAGLEVARQVFQQVDERIALQARMKDGHALSKGDIVATVEGPAASILTAERTALNFLQRMSGIATLTGRYVEAVAGTPAVILDTRKTAPGLRLLDKWAVRLGGGQNHRLGLYDMVLIKDNHIAAAGGITQAVERVRLRTRPGPGPEPFDPAQDVPVEGLRPEPVEGLAVEVEVKSLAELEEALALRVDRIMLDNMDLDEMRRAVEITAGRVPLEASGNVTLENVAAIAATGVDYISVGALTHSVKALDISLDVEAPLGSSS
jgi:nicotinate-nucleotide pyrophosphorylase (carboxylating)